MYSYLSCGDVFMDGSFKNETTSISRYVYGSLCERWEICWVL